MQMYFGKLDCGTSDLNLQQHRKHFADAMVLIFTPFFNLSKIIIGEILRNISLKKGICKIK